MTETTARLVEAADLLKHDLKMVVSDRLFLKDIASGLECLLRYTAENHKENNSSKRGFLK